MKRFTFYFILLSLFINSCTLNKTNNTWKLNTESAINKGDFQKAEALLNQAVLNANTAEQFVIDSIREIIRRIQIEFPYDKEAIKSQIENRLSRKVDDKELEEWENGKYLEYRIIDNKKRYFDRATRNLFLLEPSLKSKPQNSKSNIQRIKIIEKIISETNTMGLLCLPVTMKVDYQLTVKPNSVKEGDTLKCWLPFPNRSLEKQIDITLISTNNDFKYTTSPKDAAHSTLYMEKVAQKNTPTIFEYSFEYTSYAQYFPLKELIEKVKPYNKNSDIYKKHTQEQRPHIIFSNRIKNKALEIIGNETNPVKQVSMIYNWIDANFPWASAIEYSAISNIPEYVLDIHHGDCGQVSLLLITMLRSIGIPAQWESGWIMTPGEHGLHDWCKVYYEGIGWVPVDMSFGKTEFTENEDIKEFYKSGMDPYRLVINTNYGQPLYPQKQDIRSETVDFQRGEVECNNKNLYFNDWTYSMKITYK